MIESSIIPISFQTWLESNFPSLEDKRNVQFLHIFPESFLEHEYYRKTYQNVPNVFYISDQLTFSSPWLLDFSNFTSLEELTIEGQKLISLNLSSNLRLKKLRVPNNLLRIIEWPNFNPEAGLPTLKEIILVNNNLTGRDLSIFSNFPNLTSLFIGTNDRTRIKQDIYNRWTGSLEKISNLVNLQHLDINATDVFTGTEHLPTCKLVHFTFGIMGREKAGVKRLQNKLKRGLNRTFDKGETIDDWATEGTFPTGVQNFAKSEEKINLIRQWQDKWKEELPSQAQIEVWKH